jgi:hypothetical protein
VGGNAWIAAFRVGVGEPTLGKAIEQLEGVSAANVTGLGL